MSDSQEQLVALEQVAAPGHHSFVDGPFGSEMKSSEYSERGVRLVQLQNIGDGYWIDDNKKFIPLEKFETLRRHGAVPGDIAIAKMADPVARSCILPAVTDQFIVVADCIKLTPDPKRFDARFVSAAINSHRTRREAETKSSGTTRLRINLSALKTVHIWAPQLCEQRQIARTLDTVDEAIAKTEAVIAKLKQVRAGLLHDLLTCGLDEHGQLRDPIAHPEQFQDSPLGRIPCAWRVAQLRAVADIASGVTLGRNLDVAGTLELPYLRVANVQDGYLDLADVKTVRIFPDELYRFRLRRGDVLMNEGGDYDKLGRGTVWEDQIPVCLHQNHVFRVRCRPDVLNCYFLAAVSGSETGKRYFLRSSKQSTNLASINSTQLNAFEIPVPGLAEQEVIIKILKAQDVQLTAEARELAKLHALKSGLMSDLLTGHVRVPEGIAVAP